MKLNSEITKETRFDSFITHPTRCDDIRRVLGDKAMTARELAYALGFSERNAVAPRLTEMMKRGEVFVAGKAKDHITGKSVAVYRNVRRDL